MVEFRAQEKDVVVGHPLRTLSTHLPGLPKVLYAAVERNGKVIIPNGEFIIRPGDLVHVAGEIVTVTNFFRFLGKHSLRIKNVMILGGGRISYYLAKMIVPTGMHVSMIEINPRKAEELSETLPHVNVILGDGTDQELLEQEGLDQMDAFVAMCDRDEENLMTGLFAVKQGVPKVVVKNNRVAYADVIRGMGLDSIVSPKSITCSAILRYVRARVNSEGTKVERLYRLMNDQVEALEFIARGSDPYIGIPLRDLQVRPGTLVAVIVRRGKVIVPFGGDHIEDGGPRGRHRLRKRSWRPERGYSPMNRRLVLYLLGAIMLVEAAAMAPALLVSLIYGDGDADALLKTMMLLAALGLPLRFGTHPQERNLRAREGFLVVALAWLGLSAFGALPFVFSGMIPNYVDALFEAVSGFTTTGATVLTSFEGLPRGIMFWRSFTHWIGGMGVLVLTLALLPKLSNRTSHLVRAESPGPTLSKIVPKMGDTAKILYIIYLILTMLEFTALMLAGLNPYDAAIHAMGTAGTGGFSNYMDSVGAFRSPVVDGIITVFMVLFGANFALYYRLMHRDWRGVLHSEELRIYLGIFLTATVVITLTLLPEYGTVGNSLRYASFQVASIMSTTGYATADFNLWPIAARMLLLTLMFAGSCAGSTAGGMKICRIGMLWKQAVRSVRHTFQPRKVQAVRFEGRAVEESVLKETAAFAVVYIGLVVLGGLLIAFEGKFDIETNLTAALTCVSNVGPGLGVVGPAGNFAGYGPFAKSVLSLLMLAGRLELFPILALFHPAIWRK